MKKFILKEKYFRKIVRAILIEAESRISTDYDDADISKTVGDKEFLTKEEDDYVQNIKKNQKINEIKHGNGNIEFIGEFEYKPGITTDKVILDDNSIISGEEKKIFDNIENIKEQKELLIGIAFISNIQTKLSDEKKEKKDPNVIKTIEKCFNMLEGKKSKIYENLNSIKASNNKYVFKIPEGKDTVRWIRNEEKYVLKAYLKNSPNKYKFWDLKEDDFNNFPDNESLYPDEIKSDKDILNLVVNNKEAIKNDIEKAKKEKNDSR